MTDINWKRKLTSRKFWACVADFVVMILIALHWTEEAATQIAALIMAGAGVVAYIIGEGLADAMDASGDVYIGSEEIKPPDAEE